MLNDIIEIPMDNHIPTEQKVIINLVIDAGSTETRTICYTQDGDEIMPEVDVEPSTFAKLDYDADISDIVIPRPTTKDMFEVRLSLESGDSYTILKGSLATQVGADKRASSVKSKMEQDSTLVNIHSACIMNILKLMQTTGCALTTDNIVHIRLTLALPPEDTDASRIAKLRSGFGGICTAYLPRLGVSFNYLICPEDVVIVSECNATSMYYLGMMADEDTIDEDNVIVLECGGRSSSAAVIKEGVLMSRAHRDFDIGGTNLLQLLIDCISEKSGAAKLSMDAAEKVLCTGYVRKGSSKQEAFAEINKAKELFAKKLVDKILEAIEGSELAADDIQAIVVSGRIFGELSDENGRLCSPSLGAFIKKIYQNKWCAGTEVIRINTTYPIPQGLVLYRLGTE